ncbi:MAG: DUF6734 family protein [bacterium]
MNALFSFYSVPFEENDKLNINYASFFYSWVLSVNLAKKHFEKVILVTDTGGNDLLINKMNLPFDEVNLALNNLPVLNKNLWAYAKIYAFSLQTEPFIYIDYDVYLFNKINPYPAVIVQSIEGFDSTLLSDLFNNYINKLITANYSSEIFTGRDENVTYGYNLGIFGGTDINFVKDFCDEAKNIAEYINQNIEEITPQFSKLYEQWAIAISAVYYNKTITTYLNNKSDSVTKGYTHLMERKGDKMITYLIKNKLSALFPAAFKEITNKLNNGLLNNTVLNKWE